MKEILVIIAGCYTVLLGIVHFFLPYLLDFDHAIPKEGPVLKPFRLFLYSYGTTRGDIRGIAWVMNYAVSFALVSIGALDLLFSYWKDFPYAKILTLWIALWWVIRAFTQLYLGRRRGDWVLLIWFLSLAALHLSLAI